MSECLQPRNFPPVEIALQGFLCAERLCSNVRPASSGKKRACAPGGHGGVEDRAPTYGLQR